MGSIGHRLQRKEGEAQEGWEIINNGSSNSNNNDDNETEPDFKHNNRLQLMGGDERVMLAALETEREIS